MRTSMRPIGELPMFQAILLTVAFMASNFLLFFVLDLDVVFNNVSRITNPGVVTGMRDVALALGALYVIAFGTVLVVTWRRAVQYDEDVTWSEAISPRQLGSALGLYGALLAFAGWGNFAGPIAGVFGMAGKGAVGVAPVVYTHAISILVLNLLYLSGLPFLQIAWRRIARRRRPSAGRSLGDASVQQPITAFPPITQLPPREEDSSGVLATVAHERDTDMGADGERRWQ